MYQPIRITPQNSLAEIFPRLQANDINLQSEAYSATSSYRFQQTKPVNNLLAPGSVNFSGVEWDFDLSNGLRSLTRRGFYKITGNVINRNITNYQTGQEIPTWTAEVLYTPSINHPEHFSFQANVGPMVNVNGIGLDVRNGTLRLVTGRNTPDRQLFFQGLIGQTFYVSQQTSLQPEGSKQTVWFIF